MGKAGKAKKGLPTITFDDAKRTEFITGFHKRKNERRQHARRRIEREVKADKLQERQEKRDAIKEIHGRGVDEDDEVSGCGSGSDEEGEGAEVASYIFQDTVTTTSVTPLSLWPAAQSLRSTAAALPSMWMAQRNDASRQLRL